MDNELLQQINNDLPNIPEEPARLWLLPYASQLGWPPSNIGRWPNILGGLSLTDLRNSTWQKRNVILGDLPYSEQQQEKAMGMFRAYLLRENNIYSRGLGDEGRNKFNSLVQLILQTGRIPEPIILLEDDQGSYDVFDGNHRYMAYVASWRIWEEIENLSIEERNQRAIDLHIEMMVQPQPNQDVWFVSVRGEL